MIQYIYSVQDMKNLKQVINEILIAIIVWKNLLYVNTIQLKLHSTNFKACIKTNQDEHFFKMSKQSSKLVSIT